MMIKWPDTDFIDLSTLHQPFSASHLRKIFLLRSRQKSCNCQQKGQVTRPESCHWEEKDDEMDLLTTQKEKTIQALQVQ